MGILRFSMDRNNIFYFYIKNKQITLENILHQIPDKSGYIFRYNDIQMRLTKCDDAYMIKINHIHTLIMFNRWIAEEEKNMPDMIIFTKYI